MHNNSLFAFAQEKTSLGKRALLIIDTLRSASEPMTDREIKIRMGLPDMNCVRPRINDLLRNGLIEEFDSVACEWTGKKVRRVVAK